MQTCNRQVMKFAYNITMISFRKYFIAILMLLTLASVEANSVKEQPKLPLEIALPKLQSIKHAAITFGTGPTQAYVFIDPYCPRSQDFLALIHESQKMRSLYTYHFFLYELPRFNTAALIEDIYSQKDAKKALIDVMINHKKIPKVKSLMKKKIAAIAKIAHELNVYKRPYLILNKKRKH